MIRRIALTPCHLLSVAIAAGAFGCGVAGEPPGGSDTETTATSSQALEGYPPPFCVFGADSVQIFNRATVGSDVGSNGDVLLYAGTPPDELTVINGQITAGGSVSLGWNHTWVRGDVTAGGSVLHASSTVPPTTFVDGTITNSGTVLPETVSTETFNIGTQNIASWEDCAAAPAPGDYANAYIANGCSLTLSEGEYHFDSVNIWTGATLNIQGAVSLKARRYVAIGPNATLNGAEDPFDFQLYSDENIYVWDNMDFRGIVTAPNGTFTLGGGSTFGGCVHAQHVRFHTDTTHHDPYVGNVPNNREPLMEVELSSPELVPPPGGTAARECPPTVRLLFPGRPFQGNYHPDTQVELALSSIDGAAHNCTYRRIVDATPPFICDHSDHPCVHHPDQWDNVNLAVPGASPIQLDGLRVTNFASSPGTVGPAGFVGAYYNLVYTDNTAMSHGIYSGPLQDYEWDLSDTNPYVTETRNPLPGGGISIGNAYRWLGDMVEWRRQKVAERIVWRAWEKNRSQDFPSVDREDVDFDALPRVVREGARDQGQVGNFKLSGEHMYEGWPGACSGTQTYYQSNFTEGYQDHFGVLNYPYECYFDPFEQLHYCHNGIGTWPNPPHFAGNPASLHTWGDEISFSDRVLAKAMFDGQGRVTHFEEVTGSTAVNTWDTGGVAYDPKPGDFFWRFDRCWHGSSIRHAMVLLAEPYAEAPDPTTDTRTLSGPMFDGSAIFLLRDYDFTVEADDDFPTLCTDSMDLGDPVTCDCDRDGNNETYTCLPDNDGVMPELHPDPETGYHHAAAVDSTNPGTCICGGLGNPQRCPATLSEDPSRYEYYVGQSFSPREFFVYSRNHESKAFDWSVISTELITQPSVAAGHPYNHPEMSELTFGDVDHDLFQDVIWRRPNGPVSVAVSSEDYSQWRDSGVTASNGPFIAVDLGAKDLSSQQIAPTQDGYDDLVALALFDDWIMVAVAFNQPGDPTEFAPWAGTFSIPNQGHGPDWWRERIHFGDFNGDDITDVLLTLDDGTWMVDLRAGNGWETVGTSVLTPADPASFRFADLNHDGQMDVASLSTGGALPWRWYTFTTSHTPRFAFRGNFNSSFGECDVQSVRFLNLDGDGASTDFSADMLCLSSTGDWLLVADDTPDVAVTLNARSDAIESLAIGNFKTVGDAAPGANPARDDVLYFGGSPIEHLF